MKDQNEWLQQQPVSELKSLFVMTLEMARSVDGSTHTALLMPEEDGEQERPVPVVNFISILVGVGNLLERTLGKGTFYLWLDTFFRATLEQREAMWENDGEWI